MGLSVVCDCGISILLNFKSFQAFTLLHVNSSIVIILMGKRQLVVLLNLSSWCLMMVEWLFLAVPWGCLRFVILVITDHTHFLLLGRNASCYVVSHVLVCCVVPNTCQKHVHGLPDLPHSDYPFKYFDNLSLKIPVQWRVNFLEFFDQISETFGMSTVD